jgi:ABC-type branched-subunit amino acid transport system substrate-binding protein
VALAQGHAERALRLAGASEAQGHRTGASFWSTLDRADTERMVTAARRQLGAAAAEPTWAAGLAMNLEQAVAYALEAAPAPRAGS